MRQIRHWNYATETMVQPDLTLHLHLHLLDQVLHYLVVLSVLVLLVGLMKCLSDLHRFFWG